MIKLTDKIKDHFMKMKMKDILFLSSALIITLFLLIGSYITYRSATAIVLERTEKLYESNLEQINSKLSVAVGEIEKYTESVSKNPQIGFMLLQLHDYSSDTIEMIRIHEMIYRFLAGIQIYGASIEKVQLATEYGTFTSGGIYSSQTLDDFISYPVYGEMVMSDGQVIVMTADEAGDGRVFFSEEGNTILFFKEIAGTEGTKAILYLTMRVRWFDTVFANEKDFFIATPDDAKVIWSKGGIDPELFFSEISDKLRQPRSTFITGYQRESYKVSYVKSLFGQWHVIMFDSVRSISEGLNRIMIYTILAFFISIIVSFFISRIFAGRIVKPIYRLIERAREYNADRGANIVEVHEKHRSFREKVMIFYITVMVIPAIIYGIFFYLTSANIIEKVVIETAASSFNQTVRNTDYFLGTISRVSVSVISDINIQDFLIYSEESSNDEEPVYDTQYIQDKINEGIFILDSFFEVDIFSNEGNLLYSNWSNKSSMPESVYERFTINPSSSRVWIFHAVNRNHKNIIKLYRRVRGYPDERFIMKTIGYTAFSFYEETFADLYAGNILSGGRMYIYDDMQNVISSNDKNMIGRKLEVGYITQNDIQVVSSRDARYLVLQAKSSILPLNFRLLLDHGSISSDFRPLLTTYGYYFLIVIILLLLISYKLSLVFTKSLRNLSQSLAQLGSDTTAAGFEDDIYINEVAELASSFNNMSERINHLIYTVYYNEIKEKELENERKDAELIALQAQINPHFLHNTLETIKWMIKEKENEKAALMTEHLGSLFRLGIGKEGPIVKIREEIDYAKIYIDIQKTRFGRKLNVEWFVDQDLLDAYVPKLILQPIIENSIHHGLARMNKTGIIQIFCSENEDMIFFKIADNGKGIDDDKLIELNKALENEPMGRSIGLINVHKRIKLFYGDKYGLKISSRLGESTTVTIHMPKMTENIKSKKITHTSNN